MDADKRKRQKQKFKDKKQFLQDTKKYSVICNMVSKDVFLEMKNWLLQNTTYHSINALYEIDITFDKKEDVVKFRLAFGDYLTDGTKTNYK